MEEETANDFLIGKYSPAAVRNSLENMAWGSLGSYSEFMLLRLELESRMPTGWEPLRPLKIRALPCCKVFDKLLNGRSLALPTEPPPPPSKYKLPVEFLLSVRFKNFRINLNAQDENGMTHFTYLYCHWKHPKIWTNWCCPDSNLIRVVLNYHWLHYQACNHYYGQHSDYSGV